MANKIVIGIISSNNIGNNNAVSFKNFIKLNQSENPPRLPKNFQSMSSKQKHLKIVEKAKEFKGNIF